jgi:hypothetical protein
MYSALLSSILFADIIIKIMIGVGLLAGAAALSTIFSTIAIWEHNDILAKKLLVTFIACTVLMTSTIVIANSNYFKTEFIVLRAAAPEFDKYVEKYPESLYNPEVALTMVNDTAFSIVSSIQSFPDLIKKLSGMTSSDLEKERLNSEFEAFLEWKKKQNE